MSDDKGQVKAEQSATAGVPSCSLNPCKLVIIPIESIARRYFYCWL